MDPMMPPDSGEAQRDAALENMSRIQSLTPGDLVYKDGTPFSGRAPNGDQYIYGARLRRRAPAMDEASANPRHFELGPICCAPIPAGPG
jgi:hypothetical protein